MNTTELYRLTEWIENEIISRSIADKYAVLVELLQQHVQSAGPRPSLAGPRDALLGALTEIPLARLSQQQLRFLDELGIAQAVGASGVAAVEDALYKNVIDVATSMQVIGDLLQALQQGCNRSSQIRNGLQGVISDALYDDGGDVLMRIVFAGQAAIRHVADFKHWGELWHDIGYGIAFAQGESVEDVRIVGAASGSVVIELAVSLSFAGTASAIILAALQLTEKVQDINQKAEELRRLQLKNNKLVMDLEREAEYEIRSGVENISAQIVKTLGLRKNGEGDKITALIRAVKHLMYFIENGGDVDFVIHTPQQDAQATMHIDELCEVFRQIRELKNKLEQSSGPASITQAA